MDFNLVNEKQEFKLGNILTIFKLKDSDNEIALFTINDFDKEDNSLNIAYIKKDKEGYDYLEEINDKKVFNEAMMVARDMMNAINKNKVSR